MFTDADRVLLHTLAQATFTSHSPFRHLSEGHLYNLPHFIQTIDGNAHAARVIDLAVNYGDVASVMELLEVAAAADDPTKYPDRQADAVLAAAVLARVPSAAIVAARAALGLT